MPDYDAVLFDSDGVLVEPPGAETQTAAIRRAFQSVGVDDPDQGHVQALTSGVTSETLDDIGATYEIDPVALWEAREHHDEQSQFEAFRAGDRDRYDDTAAVSDIPLPRGVVSNNHHSTIEFVLEFFEFDDDFDTYYGREKTVESLGLKKPNTHYVERALDDLGGGSALYVGDSENDVLAAHRAGLDSVFLRRQHCRSVDLSVDPTYELETLHGLAALLDE
ncbi:HAD-IA family hydrolase [Natronomonas gomsonensis]|uniref:HAD family hydrolase n=1 Tax=Natronomonas gomsonensis TaxID=1046043 RepID=UPI0020CA856A|nr:HAD-IA family hydrolase [Natronomonas gomsonensis]MCY4732293.1 HAD-IA family hydrolase [Natronomonas gomsonensis]